jgi:hypothetical protein
MEDQRRISTCIKKALHNSQPHVRILDLESEVQRGCSFELVLWINITFIVREYVLKNCG